jgi:Cu-Zn family superoxide dismutase
MLCAEAIFCKPGSNKIKGSVAFSQYDPNFVRVDINLIDVPIGIHGIHVHENPIKFFKNTDYCKQAGIHFNGPTQSWSPKTPGGIPHGSFIHDTIRHIGDMCNNITSINGIVNVSYDDYLISLISDHPHCILGRSVVIHENKDDEGLYIRNKNLQKREIESKISGNAGKRIGCANIVLLNTFEKCVLISQNER